jgi:hypothetical protein
MPSSFKLTLIAGAGPLMAARSAWAHHAFEAEFDANKPVKLPGCITQVEWINPHVSIHLDVEDADGKVANWMWKAALRTLLRGGFTKKILPEGAEIIVDGYQSKDGALRANGRDITFADGKKLFVGSSARSDRANRRQNNNLLLGILLPPPVIRAILLVAGDTSIIEPLIERHDGG